MVHHLRGGRQTGQGAVDAAAVHLDVEGLAGGGGPLLQLLRAVEGDRVREAAHGTPGVVDVAGVVGEGFVGSADPDVAEDVGGEDGGVRELDARGAGGAVDVAAVAQPEHIPVGAVGVEVGWGGSVREDADSGSDGEGLGADGGVPVYVVFDDQGCGGVAVDDADSGLG